MITVEDVYTPEEMLRIHRLHGWTNYIFSSAHVRRMQAAQFKLEDEAYAAHVKALGTASHQAQDTPEPPPQAHGT